MPFTVRLRRGQMMGIPESRNGPRPWRRFPHPKSGVLSQEIHRATQTAAYAIRTHIPH
jgi:hypothetical protein